MDEESIARAVAKGNVRSKSRERVYSFWVFWVMVLAGLVGWVGSVVFDGLLGGLIAGAVVFCALGYPLHRWYVGD